jgi:hypothetical protein
MKVGYRRALAASQARVEALEGAYALLWSFDISPTFDAKGRYTERKANEWKQLLERAQILSPRPLAALAAAAPNGPSDATDAASPRQGLEDDSSGCLTGTGWAKETGDGA